MSVVTQLRNAKAAEAALRNERLTHQRVEQLEAAFGGMARITADHMDFMQMGFLDRLRWLLTGKTPARQEPVCPPVTKSPEDE